MAINSTVGGEGTLFVGEDKVLRFECIDQDGNPVDITGWSMIFDIRKKETSRDPAMIARTDFVIVGTFNSVRASNTQRALLTLTDDEMNLFKAKTYQCSWKRLDADVEAVLQWGPFTPEKATAQ